MVGAGGAELRPGMGGVLLLRVMVVNREERESRVSGGVVEVRVVQGSKGSGFKGGGSRRALLPCKNTMQL